MNKKKKRCDNCGNDKITWKNYKGKRYCKQCWSARSVTNRSKPKAKQKTLPYRSRKRMKEEVEYSQKRRIFLSNHPMCEAHVLGICAQHASDVHHTYNGKDRAIYFLDVTTWKAVCRSCHMWIHEHPKSARELGLLK